MARLKPFPFLSFLLFLPLPYFALNVYADHFLFDCAGDNVPVSGIYAEKIETARKLFTKPLSFPEPLYYVRITQCYNAWAFGDNKVVVSEAAIKNLSSEELAGLLGHELAHTEAHINQEFPEHWKIDVRGAEFTSKEIMIKKLNRMLKEYNNIFENNKLLMNILPLPYYEYANIRDDYLFRVDMVNSHLK